MRHITLIRPPIISSANSFSSPVTPPIALAYLTSALEEQGYEVTPIDAVGEAIDKVYLNEKQACRIRGLSIVDIISRIPDHTDLIGVSCMFTQEWLLIKEVVEAVSKEFPDVPIVLGGEHVTAIPNFILETCPFVDLCTLGEGEETIVDIAKNYPNNIDKIAGIAYRNKEGQVIRSEPRKRIRDVEAIARPNWKSLPLEAYLKSNFRNGINVGRTIPMLATRGCPYQCTFCSNKEMWGQRYYTRPPADVIEEIEHYVRDYNVEVVEFYDLTAIVRKDWIVEFGNLLKERKINIAWSLPSGTRSEALDDEVTKLMAETNCKYMAYAAESGSNRILKYIKKAVDLDKMLASMKQAKKNGLNLRCNLMLGFPKETRSDVFKTLWFQMKLAVIGVDDAPLYMFSAYPGTELFDYLRSQNRIPELGEGYFKSLLCQMDLTKTGSHCENIHPRELVFYRIMGMSLFYGLSYLLHPSRILRTIRNIFFTRKTNTVFEQRVMERFTENTPSQPLRAG